MFAPETLASIIRTLAGSFLHPSATAMRITNLPVRCGHHAMSKTWNEDVIADSANQTVEFALTEAVALCCAVFDRLVRRAFPCPDRDLCCGP